ncbi:MAG: hypothetical protein GXY87_06645 [Tissierellia bacterium]|nr:hypothetical protein [Tissierellia bacterium]
MRNEDQNQLNEQMDRPVRTPRQRRRKPALILGAKLFFGTLMVVFLIGILFPLRPAKSESEKRELTKFPSFTIEGFMDGDFFNQLSLWYADTFPFRDALINLNNKFKGLYGIKDTQLVTNTQVKADDIPDEVPVAQNPKPTTPTENPDDQTTNPNGENNTQDPEGTTQTPTKPSELDVKYEDGTIYNKPEPAGDVYITGDRAFSLFYFSQEGADLYAELIDKIQRSVPSTTVYDILAPTAVGVGLDEKIQEEIGSSNQRKAFEYITKKIQSLNDKVVMVDAYDNIKKHNADYIFFRTDHHWTQMGAYYAYEAFAKAKGVEPTKLENMEKVEFPDFIGTLYSASNQASVLKSNPDTVVAYRSKAVSDMIFVDENQTEVSWPIIMDVSDWNSGSKYNTFIGGDNGYSVIDNPNISNNKNVVFIKESYGNAFAPFLVDHYDKVYIIDYRYFYKYDKFGNDLLKFIEDHNVEDVVLLNNAEAVTFTTRIKQINGMFTR